MKSLLSLFLLLVAFFYVQSNMSHGQEKMPPNEYEDIQYYRTTVQKQQVTQELCHDQNPKISEEFTIEL